MTAIPLPQLGIQEKLRLGSTGEPYATPFIPLFLAYFPEAGLCDLHPVHYVLQHPVVRHLVFLCYSPSHMQICVKILRFEFFKFYNYFHISVALHVSTDIVIIRCFEIAVEIPALPSVSSYLSMFF
jgi:hypothetical protein